MKREKQTAEFWGFVKVAASTTEVRVGDCKFNVEKVVERLVELNNKGVKLAVLPELIVTGYSCGDLFYQKALLNGAMEGILTLLEFSKTIDTVFVVGCPFFHNTQLYNAAYVIHQGKLLGIVPKTYLPNYNEFSERRQFAPAPHLVEFVTIFGQNVPFGTDIIFRDTLEPSFSFAVEICEDVWVSTPPSSRHAENGAMILCNLSSSNEAVGKADYRRTMVLGQASKTISAYVYASSGPSESTTDLLFSGHNIIAENRKILKETALFSHDDAICEIDLVRLENRRHKLSNFRLDKQQYTVSGFSLPLENPKALDRTLVNLPFVPTEPKLLEEKCQLILQMQSVALARRFDHIKAKKLVIGVSGGLDSTLALLACVRAMKALNRPNSDIIAVTMPGLGTTSRTKNNAEKLCKLLDTTFLTIDITKAVLQHFEDIGHDKYQADVVFENSQARQRTQILMNLANKHSGLVVGTGDLSELALGYCTFNGDHMSNYSVNCTVPKTLISHILAFEGKNLSCEISEILNDIADTPISAELLPKNQGELVQKTEEIVGPYALTDFFLYHFIKGYHAPSKLLFLAEIAFSGIFDKQTIKKWLKVFLKRFFSQQFKRNCMPDGIKVGAVSLSPRGDWKMPSDAFCDLWLAELESE